MKIRKEELDQLSSTWSWSPGIVCNHRTGRQLPAEVCQLEGQRYQIWLAGQCFEVELESTLPRRAGGQTSGAHGDRLQAAMPGTVLAIRVQVGEAVVAGQTLVVMESMKMELNLESPRDGKVAKIQVSVGDRVELGQILLELETT